MEFVRVGGRHEAGDDIELVADDPARLNEHCVDSVPTVLPTRWCLGVVAHRRHGHLEGEADAEKHAVVASCRPNEPEQSRKENVELGQYDEEVQLVVAPVEVMAEQTPGVRSGCRQPRVRVVDDHPHQVWDQYLTQAPIPELPEGTWSRGLGVQHQERAEEERSIPRLVQQHYQSPASHARAGDRPQNRVLPDDAAERDDPEHGALTQVPSRRREHRRRELERYSVRSLGHVRS
jgi:hypothetical protein